MNRIHVLDQTTIDKIAAGEVVERPASIVKELVENSIDAGATRITVEIRDGGISMIRITDNGRGIDPEDIPLAFLRHATSKIEKIGDLDTLVSLGFRGEALSSISAVSRVELITKREEDLAAIRYLIEGGREKLMEEIGAPDGTTMIVRDIFYNTPARAKFLKTALTEAAHVGDVVEQLMLSNPQIAFTFLVNGQTKLSSGGSGDVRSAIFQIYGRSLKDDLVKIEYNSDWLNISGYIGKPSISRGNRNYENYYVNGRYVKSRIIAKAIEDGYGTKLMQHQYPFTCMMMTVDGSAVDVNVHPTKMDVRFSDEKKIYNAIRDAVSESLRSLEMIVVSTVNEKAKPAPEELRPKEKPIQAFEQKAAEIEDKGVLRETTPEWPVQKESPISKETVVAAAVSEKNHTTEVSEKPALPTAPAKTAPPTAPETVPTRTIPDKETGKWEQQSFAPTFLSKEAKPLRRIIGQVFQTYWVCEFDEKMYLFDQHAAHERVLFERLMEQYSKREISSQMINPPMLVTLDAKEQGLLESYMDAFTDLGFEIESFGERDYAIRAVPYSLGSIDSASLFKSLLSQLEVNERYEEMEVYVHRIATEACKAAVKGGEKMSLLEAGKLLDDMMNCQDPYHCPHGRPTIISFTKSDLEKRFKRIV